MAGFRRSLGAWSRRGRTLVLLASIGLAGCSGARIADTLPQQLGGLPEGTPQRPVGGYAYPAVYDTPPPRDTKPLSDDEQLKVQKSLEAVRNRQEGLQAPGEDGDGKQASPAKARTKAAPAAKKKPAAGENGAAGSAGAGAETNP